MEAEIVALEKRVRRLGELCESLAHREEAEVSQSLPHNYSQPYPLARILTKERHEAAYFSVGITPRRQYSYLLTYFRCLSTQAKGYGEEAQDVTELKAERRQLESLLEVLRLSKPDKGKH